MRTATRLTLVLAAILAWGLAIPPSQALAAKPDKIDINSATQSELESLPGVGAATAKKIIAGRPYSSVQALSRAGVSADTIEKIKPLVKAGRGSAGVSPRLAAGQDPRGGAQRSTAAAEPAKAEKAAVATKEEKTAKPAKEEKKAGTMAPSGARVDLNTASEKELEALPAVGAATAKKIIAGRPYASVAELAKAGIPAKTIETISPLVTVGAKPAAPASSAPPPAPASKPAAAPAKAPSSSEASSAPAVPPPSKGMVWVNTETKVFHREGDKWYGNTKHGKYMTEADAVKAGYRESKEHMKK
jgi:DNA uptake protein ComE-like DNA-binding protein